MFRWKLMLQTVFGSRSEQPKSRRPKKTVELSLERLEDRTVLSATNPLGEASVASQPPAPSVAAATSYMDSNLSQGMQRLATQQQDLLNAVQVVNQEIAQVVFYAKMELGHFFGINLIASNQLSNAASVTQTNSSTTKGSGAGSGAATTHHESDQPIHSFAQTAGSGKGSGVSPDSGGGAASVYGNVWLDNDGNGAIDNGEQGFSGINVALYVVGSGTALMTTTTDSSGNYSFTVPNLPPPPGAYYYIAVGIPNLDYATIPGYSQINSSGDSAQFALYAGAPPVQINAGIRSMNVTTLQDDPNAAIPMQITLRDAIQTGNNGPPTTTVTFIDPTTGKNLSGTIGLQKALDPIKTSYNIIGPGTNPITVDGGGNAAAIFTVNAGVTSEIDGLIITGGVGANGGGINNNGNLTLKADTVSSNKASGQGGGIYNGKGSLKMFGDQILSNNAAAGGGLYNAGGTVTITGGSAIKKNKALITLGGGIDNTSGTVTVSGGTVINTNSTSASGGGVANSGTFLMTGGAISHNFMIPGPNAGGGVYNPGSMRLIGVQVEDNSAVNGGGIYTTGKLVLGKNTNINSNNKASSNGGGMFVNGGTAIMVGGGVTNNTAQQSGGGIYVLSGELMLKSDVVVSTNNAVGNGGGGYGGGIYIEGGKVTVSGGTSSANRAGASGGGIYNFAGTLTLEESVNVTENVAINKGGGIYLAGNLSTTTFNGVLVSGNKTNGNQNNTGWGVYQQAGASIIPPLNLTDNDDPNGKPVQGP